VRSTRARASVGLCRTATATRSSSLTGAARRGSAAALLITAIVAMVNVDPAR
jgi:hypothetical protein